MIKMRLEKKKKKSDSFDITGYFVIYKAIVRENLFKNCKLTTIPPIESRNTDQGSHYKKRLKKYDCMTKKCSKIYLYLAKKYNFCMIF